MEHLKTEKMNGEIEGYKELLKTTEKQLDQLYGEYVDKVNYETRKTALYVRPKTIKRLLGSLRDEMIMSIFLQADVYICGDVVILRHKNKNNFFKDKIHESSSNFLHLFEEEFDTNLNAFLML